MAAFNTGNHKPFGTCCPMFVDLFTATLPLRFKSCSWQGVLDITLCDKVFQRLATGRWFSPGTPGFSTNKTDRHDINEILLKVALNTTNQSIHSIVKTLQLMFKTLTTLKSNHPYNDLQIYSCSLICKPLYLNFNALFPT